MAADWQDTQHDDNTTLNGGGSHEKIHRLYKVKKNITCTKTSTCTKISICDPATHVRYPATRTHHTAVVVQGVRKNLTQVFCNKIGNKHGMSKIQASLYSKLNGKASDVSHEHLHWFVQL